MAKVVFTPQYEAIINGLTTKTYILIRLQGPKLPEEQSNRAPINLSIVLDRSGSMGGRPLEEAKKCAEMIIDSLQEKDKASIIAYADYAETIMPLTTIKSRQAIKTAIESIQVQGMTALYDGWNAGAKTLPQNPKELSRVLLLSDGQANRGITDLDTIQKEAIIYADKGITTSTYGLGVNFNEELMINMAKSGGGNAYYGETADDLMDPFMEEFELLSNLYAKNIRLKIHTANGIKASILNLYPSDQDGFAKLPSLAYESETWALLEIIIPKEASTVSKAVNLASIQVQYQDMNGVEHQPTPLQISLPTVSTQVFDQLVEHPLVKSRKQEIRAAEITDQAREALKRGDLKKLKKLQKEAKNNAANNPWLESIVATLNKMLAEGLSRESSLEMDFTSARMRTRLTAIGEKSDNLHSSQSYLRRKIRQGKKGT